MWHSPSIGTASNSKLCRILVLSPMLTTTKSTGQSTTTVIWPSSKACTVGFCNVVWWLYTIDWSTGGTKTLEKRRLELGLLTYLLTYWLTKFENFTHLGTSLAARSPNKGVGTAAPKIRLINTMHGPHSFHIQQLVRFASVYFAHLTNIKLC